MGRTFTYRMLSASADSPFEEDPIVKAARAAASAAQGHTPNPAARHASLSTTPLQAPPQHITDSPGLHPLQQPSPAKPPLPTSADMLDSSSDDAVVIASEPSPTAAQPAKAASVGGSGIGSSASLAPLTAADVAVPAIKARNKYKVVFLGDESTGKTSIITRFMYDSFDQHYKVTIGIDFVSRTMHVKDRAVRLQLWDTAGQERFRSLIPSYIRDATVAVLVYDIGSRQSFSSCAHWLTDVHADRGTDILLLLAGNKSDLAHDGKRAVPAAEARQWARENGLLWCEVSAKTGDGVKAMMTRLVASLPAEGEREERVEGFGSESRSGGAGGGGSSGAGGTVDVKLTGQPSQQAEGGGCYC